MRFNDEVVMQDLSGIPLVGNLASGYVIGLTGEGAEVCKRLMAEDVPEDEIAAVDANLLHHLTQGGFFADDGANGSVAEGIGSDAAMRNSDAQIAEEATESVSPNASTAGSVVAGGSTSALPVLSAYLHVTQRCNLQCRGCYSLDEKRNVLADAPLSDICRAVDQLADAGLQRLVISGGEPFLREDLTDIVKHAKERGIPRVDVLSNGTRITPEALQAMTPYVDGVSVSFDGHSADSVPYIRREQRFDELVTAVHAIQEAGIAAHIIPTAHAKNIRDLPKYVTLAHDLGATMNFSLLTCEPGDPDLGGLLPDDATLRELGRSMLTMGEGGPVLAVDSPIGVNLAVKRDCGAGSKTISIDADGTVYPCHMLHRPELAMGNAFTGSLSDALSSDAGKTMRSLEVEDFEGCRECRYEYICGGGCRARSLYATGSLHQPDSYCAMICEFYDALGAHMAASMRQAQQG